MIEFLDNPTDDHNRDVLANSGFGPYLLDAYGSAIALDERVATTEIVALPPTATPLAEAIPSYASPTGKHQVRLALGNSSLILARFAHVLHSVQGVREHFARHVDLDLEPSDITPLFMMVHGSLHEFGHTTDYEDNLHNRIAYWRRIWRDRQTMPLGANAVSVLLDPNTPQHHALAINFGVYSQLHNVTSMAELLGKQHKAYRNLRHERRADLFASRVLKTNPRLLHALIQPETPWMLALGER